MNPAIPTRNWILGIAILVVTLAIGVVGFSKRNDFLNPKSVKAAGPPLPITLILTPDEPVLGPAGSPVAITAVAYDATGQSLSTDVTYSWNIIPGSTEATLSSNGNIATLTPGPAVGLGSFKATASGSWGNVSRTSRIQISKNVSKFTDNFTGSGTLGANWSAGGPPTSAASRVNNQLVLNTTRVSAGLRGGSFNNTNKLMGQFDIMVDLAGLESTSSAKITQGINFGSRVSIKRTQTTPAIQTVEAWVPSTVGCSTPTSVCNTKQIASHPLPPNLRAVRARLTRTGTKLQMTYQLIASDGTVSAEKLLANYDLEPTTLDEQTQYLFALPADNSNTAMVKGYFDNFVLSGCAWLDSFPWTSTNCPTAYSPGQLPTIDANPYTCSTAKAEISVNNGSWTENDTEVYKNDIVQVRTSPLSSTTVMWTLLPAILNFCTGIPESLAPGVNWNTTPCPRILNFDPVTVPANGLVNFITSYKYTGGNPINPAPGPNNTVLCFDKMVVKVLNSNRPGVVKQVAAASDDVNQDGVTLVPNPQELWLGTGQNLTSSYTGLRFTGLNIPRGKKILTAKLEVYSRKLTWINMSFDMYAHTIGNSPTFSEATRPSTRPLTTAKVNHSSNIRWFPGVWYTLEDISPVIQEVVNRPDWNPGNSLSLILKGTGTTQWGRKYINGFEIDSSVSPRLLVTY